MDRFHRQNGISFGGHRPRVYKIKVFKRGGICEFAFGDRLIDVSTRTDYGDGRIEIIAVGYFASVVRPVCTAAFDGDVALRRITDLAHAVRLAHLRKAVLADDAADTDASEGLGLAGRGLEGPVFG